MNQPIKSILTKFNSVSLLLLIVITATSISCNNDTLPAREASKDWLKLDIKFNAGSNAESRDSAIRQIEKVIMDTLTNMRAGRYPHFSPHISIEKDLFQDPLVYHLSVGNPGPAIAQDSIPPPKCLCKSGCRICTVQLSNGTVVSVNPDQK